MDTKGKVVKKIVIATLAFVCFAAFILTSALCGSVKIAKGLETAVASEAKSCYLMDSQSGKVLYSNNETKRLPVASMVKTMTLLLTFEAIDNGALNMEDEILASEKAQSMGGSQVFLDAGSKYKTTDLIKSVVMASANDAAVALAEAIAGSEETFVSKMNDKAKALGLEDTNFVNCTGLPAPESYSCAKDISIIFANLIKHKEYFNYTQIRLDELIHPSGRKTELVNTNKLFRQYKNCDAGKTGSTSEAGFCLTSTAKQNNFRLISTVVGAKTGKERFSAAQNLFDYGFANFENKNIVSAKDIIKINAKRAIKDEIEASYERGYNVVSKKGEAVDYKVENILDEVKAPKKVGDKVGEALISDKDGNVVDKIAIILREDIAAKTYLYNIKEIIKYFN